MHEVLNIFGMHIPAYGTLVVLGTAIANIIAIYIVKKEKLDINDFIVMEGYAVLGGIIGAKVLYLIVSFKEIDWSRFIHDDVYAAALMSGGFVFYGGLILGLVFVIVAGKVHKIDAMRYIREMICLIPLIHCFGRIGCFMAGCCFGIPYEGFGAVVFPEGCAAIPGIKLFPVQLVEAGCLLIISIIILVMRRRFRWEYTLETYLILYAILRFALENLRYDDFRGIYFGLSTSQWISCIMLAIGVISSIYRRKVLAKQK